MKINFQKVFLIIFVSSLLGLTVNFFSSKSIPLARVTEELSFAEDSLFSNTEEDIINTHLEKDTVSVEEKGEINEGKPENSSKEIKEPLAVKLDQAFKLYEKGVLFIDAREPEDFLAGHIKGSINLPFYADDHESILKNIDKEKPLVIYCGGTDCDLSHLLANELSELGYQNVYVFFGGWNDWLEKNYPTENQ